MTQAIRFQDPGEGIRDGEVVEIAVSSGDTVREGQVVLVVETDKADFEIESPHSGSVEQVNVRVGDTVRVGQTLVTLGSNGAEARSGQRERRDDEANGGARSRGSRSENGDQAPRDDERATGSYRESRENGHSRRRSEGSPVPASPATRRLARELGVDLHEVPPTGEEGRVLAHDVRAHAAEASQSARERPREPESTPLPDLERFGPVERESLPSVRRTIARRMTQAWQTIPHVMHGDVADITELEAFRRRQSARLESEDASLTLTALIMKASVAALREHPRFNASFDPDSEEIVYRRYYHIGLATDTDRGLLVPSIRDVDRKSVLDLARELPRAAERARNGKIGRDEMQRATFTLTNVGAIGGTHFTPIINPPQVAILGLGRARREPSFDDADSDERVVPRLLLPLSLAFDHRANDGADAARFMRRLIQGLHDPETFALAT